MGVKTGEHLQGLFRSACICGVCVCCSSVLFIRSCGFSSLGLCVAELGETVWGNTIMACCSPHSCSICPHAVCVDDHDARCRCSVWEDYVWNRPSET
ncbi:hypothetical protein N658DRAFT_356368 [Parathielavia hyrcaniae]|uniref:Uncharacterized protein n=1 Tax=Parathielavia hyrcaniae TaxID=113614 RepID=A0AAN6Q7M2_9PEZI|nr:hypothetical protein N658DRAFT_356368 [Parathielavia hyrcaniae]